MFLKVLKITIVCALTLWIQFAHCQDRGEMKTNAFGNKFFSIMLPTDWAKDNSKKGMVLIPPENDKGLHIMIYILDNPNKADRFNLLSRDKEEYEILRDEYELSSTAGYRLFDGYKKGTKDSGFRMVNMIMQNKTHLVVLSFGDYACSSKFCSNELISTIESSFVVLDPEGQSLSFKEFRDQFH